MKLNTLNTETLPTTRDGKPTVTLSKGASSFNWQSVEMLDLKPGDTIEIHQDDDPDSETHLNFFLSKGGVKDFHSGVAKQTTSACTSIMRVSLL